MFNPLPCVGLTGRADREIWNCALDHDFAVVTTNAQDFIELLNVDVDPGFIVFRRGRPEPDRTVGPHPTGSERDTHQGFQRLNMVELESECPQRPFQR